jgi:hypothetical protein
VQAGRIAQSIVRERFRRSEMLQRTYAVYRRISRRSTSPEYLPETSAAEPTPIYDAGSGAGQ